MGELEPVDRELLNRVQEGFPVASEPYRVLDEVLGLDPGETLERVRRLVQSGFIRRIRPIFSPRKLGYGSTLVAVRVGSNEKRKLIRLLKSHPGVSHLYRRRAEIDIWFTLVHRDPEEELDRLRRMFPESTFINLPTRRMFKLRANFEV